MQVDRRIARLAQRQHGRITAGQLERLGLTRGEIDYRLEVGRLHRVHAGVFAVGHADDTSEGQMLAAVMACGHEAVLSHLHAAHLWDILPPWVEVDLSAIHVTVPPGCRRGRRPGIVVHRAELGEQDRSRRRDIPITSPAHTLLDLGSIVQVRDLERAVDQVLTDELAAPDALWSVVAMHPRRRGARALRSLLEATERFDRLTRSQLEEALLALIRQAQLPEPQLNMRLAGYRIDAAWPHERVAVEVDGYRWHRTRRRLESDRRREAAIRRAGWMPLRYSARQVLDEGLAVLADLSRALAERRGMNAP